MKKLTDLVASSPNTAERKISICNYRIQGDYFLSACLCHFMVVCWSLLVNKVVHPGQKMREYKIYPQMEVFAIK
jgi:hypothetical protein